MFIGLHLPYTYRSYKCFGNESIMKMLTFSFLLFVGLQSLLFHIVLFGVVLIIVVTEQIKILIIVAGSLF